MQFISNIAELRDELTKLKNKGKKLALVPTMGALHNGHLSLVKVAREQADIVAMSIFVNPVQFNSKEDLEKYPRDIERDLALAQSAGVDLVFAPEERDIYPIQPGASESDSSVTKVIAGSRSLGLCGATRPGHFNGVVQVVAILFNLFKPDLAVFGEKDYQQLKVIEQLNSDLHFDIKILAAPLLRDQDGLALSSRNARLSAQDRREALAIPSSLIKAKERFRAGEREVDKIKAAVNRGLSKTNYLIVDYVEVVDSETLEPLKNIAHSAQLCVAVFCGSVRLIDNIRLDL